MKVYVVAWSDWEDHWIVEDKAFLSLPKAETFLQQCQDQRQSNDRYRYSRSGEFDIEEYTIEE